MIALLDGGGDGDGARAAAHTAPLKPSVSQFAIDEFRVVGGDIDEGRLQFRQFVDVGKQPVSACAFQRRQHLKRELPLSLVLVDNVGYAHGLSDDFRSVGDVDAFLG